MRVKNHGACLGGWNYGNKARHTKFFTNKIHLIAWLTQEIPDHFITSLRDIGSYIICVFVITSTYVAIMTMNPLTQPNMQLLENFLKNSIIMSKSMKGWTKHQQPFLLKVRCKSQQRSIKLGTVQATTSHLSSGSSLTEKSVYHSTNHAKHQVHVGL